VVTVLPQSSLSSVYHSTCYDATVYRVIAFFVVDYAAVIIGRITGLACLSVRLSLMYGLLTRKQKGAEKPKLGVNVPMVGVAVCQFSVPKVRIVVRVRVTQCSWRVPSYS